MLDVFMGTINFFYKVTVVLGEGKIYCPFYLVAKKNLCKGYIL